MNNWLLWLRWSWRDLRQRWLQVLAIALIIALGTGVYSGLISTSDWRLQSNDASFALLNMYDLRLSLTKGSYLDQEELVQAVAATEHADWITAVEPRLIQPTLVDASTADQTIIIPGRLIGAGIPGAGQMLNDVAITAGRAIEPAEAGQPVALLEHKFAAYYDLPPTGELRLSGDRTLPYVGTGLSPEYFIVFTEEGGMMAEANFAALFVSLATAQELAGRPGLVNELLFKLAPGADPEVVQAEVTTAVTSLAEVGLSFMEPADDQAYNLMYEDIDSDELFWRWMAYLFLAGAVFGAFNLATRLVEAQRREIGIQMALGLPPRRIAIRPLLIAVQIASLGVLLGLAIGWLIGRAFGDVLQSMMPLPVFLMPFQPRVVLEAAALGLVLPLLATLIPVIRALRVEPVDAIRTGHLVAKGGGLAPLLARFSLPGRILSQMPFRNLLCAPRRSLMTVFGIAAAITLLVLVMGVLDSFDVTLAKGRSEILQDEPRRMIVQFDAIYPVDSPQLSNISQDPAIGASDPLLKLAGSLKHGGVTIQIALDLVNLNSQIWRPSLASGRYPEQEPGLLIAANAARDLGVEPGDTITLRHPQRTGLLTYDWVESEIEVSGIHQRPVRSQTYLDIRHAGVMGLTGLVNALHVTPAPAISQDELKQRLFDQAGVASVQPVTAVIQVFEELIGEFVDMFLVMQAAAVILAALMAYNSASINLDERARELATMFAFGVPIRTALRVAIVETLLTSLIGTAIGCGLGALVLIFMLRQVFATTAPDIDVIISLQLQTLITAVLIGVLVAIFTPLLNSRKLTRMDIPAALRVME